MTESEFDPKRSAFKGLGRAVRSHLHGLTHGERVTSRDIATKLGSRPTHVNSMLLSMQGRRVRFDPKQKAWYRVNPRQDQGNR
jgi:hypothetical protein